MEEDHIWDLIAKKLAGEASADEQKELKNALRLDPDLHYSVEALHDFWKRKIDLESRDPESAFQKHLERMRSLGISMGEIEEKSSTEEYPVSSRRFRQWKALALSIATILLFFISFYFLSLQKPPESAEKPLWEVETRNGTRTNLLLPDGTTVWLNAGSKLTYDSLYGTMNREVTLSGEGYFDVVRNPKKPFIIHTGKINIRVLGTEFNVKSYPGEKTIETSLIKGSIEVTFTSISDKKIILKPNQKLVILKSEMTANTNENLVKAETQSQITVQHLNKIGADGIIAETGWVQNRLYFNDISFHELLKSMERKYGVSFQLSDASLDTIHFTGSFQNETVMQALDALRLTAVKSTADFTYEMQGNQVFIHKNTKVVNAIHTK